MGEILKKIGEASMAAEIAGAVKVLIVCASVVAVASMGVDVSIGMGG